MGILDEMQRLVIAPAITHEGAAAFLAELPTFGGPEAMADPGLAEFLAPTSQAEFCVSGEVYTVKPILTSPVARENYLYVQSLSILAMDRLYYTHRFFDDSYLILYTLSGKGRVEFEGRTILLHPGDGIWIDCKREHRYSTEGDTWSHVALHFRGHSAASLYAEYTAAHGLGFYQALGGAFHRSMEQLIRDYGTLSFGREVRIASGLFAMLSLLVTDPEVKTSDREVLLDNMEQVLLFLEQHMGEAVTLDELAVISHTSKYHLSHEFQRLTGYAPIEYLIQLRLHKACLLLQTTSLPVTKIAELVGIPNNQYFGKLFKKKLGKTPGEYRNATKV